MRGPPTWTAGWENCAASVNVAAASAKLARSSSLTYLDRGRKLGFHGRAPPDGGDIVLDIRSPIQA
jgi:hypothetical protein